MRYVIIELAALTALAVSAISCGHRNGIPESLKGIKENVAQIDSAVNAMYGWEPRDSTFNHSVDTLVAGIMNEYNANDPEYQHLNESTPAIEQQAYDEARVTWGEFKRLIDADKYEDALNYYLGEGDDYIKKNSGDFLVYLKHSTQRFEFFSEVLRPLMQEYKGKDYALEEYINNLQLEKVLEDASIDLHAENTGYVPEVYPHVIRELGLALATSGKMDEAHELFYDLIDGVYGLTGSALFANYIASEYAEQLYLIEDDKDGAIANWNRFKEAIEQNKTDFDTEEVEICLKRIAKKIEELE